LSYLISGLFLTPYYSHCQSEVTVGCLLLEKSQ